MLCATIVMMAIQIGAVPSAHTTIEVGPSSIVPNGVRKAPTQKNQSEQGVGGSAVRRVQVTANGKPTVTDEVVAHANPNAGALDSLSLSLTFSQRAEAAAETKAAQAADESTVTKAEVAGANLDEEERYHSWREHFRQEVLAEIAFNGDTHSADHASDSDHLASLREQCQPFLTEARPETMGTTMKGFSGGHWSPCTHLKVYGLNFAPFVGWFLAYQLAPKTALEFGCGLGTTADFVARFADATVTCVEPEKTLGELIMSIRGDMKGNGALQQLAVNVFSDEPQVQSCVRSGALKSDLVYSFEVAEHIPAKFRNVLVSTLVNATAKWLVFSAARPGQGGTGHIPEAMLTREEWQAIFEDAGMIYMPKLTELVRQTAYIPRSYDLFSNLLVFRSPSHAAEDTDVPHPKLAKFGRYWGTAVYAKKFSDSSTPQYLSDNTQRSSHLSDFYEGAQTALWPGLMEKQEDARHGRLCQKKDDPSLIEGERVDERHAFESAWGAYFY
jgi:hypothetical protein